MIYETSTQTFTNSCFGCLPESMGRPNNFCVSRDNKWAAGDTFAGNVWLIDVATGHRYQMASDAKMTPDHAQPFIYCCLVALLATSQVPSKKL